VSPEVGVIDEEAFDELATEDPEEALGLLADLVGATDAKLRAAAARLASQVIGDTVITGQLHDRGIGRLESVPLDAFAGDLDLDASSEGLVEWKATGVVDTEAWRVRRWGRPNLAVCVLLDRSGSMTGTRLAQSAVVAAAVTQNLTGRPRFRGEDLSVLAFSKEVVAVRSADRPRSMDGTVEDVLRMRGHGVTDLDAALRAAREMLGRSDARRKVTLLLSDCRYTLGAAPESAARALDELCILCPAEDVADAEDLAGRVGARWTPLAGITDAAAAVRRVLDRTPAR
jgi:Mg-chelatase subunit ChlD